MCLMDYDFLVLDNAFLVHKPGIKTPENNPTKPNQALVKKQNQLINNVVKPELVRAIGKRQGCL